MSRYSISATIGAVVALTSVDTEVRTATGTWSPTCRRAGWLSRTISCGEEITLTSVICVSALRTTFTSFRASM